jgi:hypothetical protein
VFDITLKGLNKKPGVMPRDKKVYLFASALKRRDLIVIILIPTRFLKPCRNRLAGIDLQE